MSLYRTRAQPERGRLFCWAWEDMEGERSARPAALLRPRPRHANSRNPTVPTIDTFFFFFFFLCWKKNRVVRQQTESSRNRLSPHLARQITCWAYIDRYGTFQTFLQTHTFSFADLSFFTQGHCVTLKGTVFSWWWWSTFCVCVSKPQKCKEIVILLLGMDTFLPINKRKKKSLF